MIRRFEPEDEEQCIDIIRRCFDESIILEPKSKEYLKKLFTTPGYLPSKIKKYDVFVYLDDEKNDKKILGMGAIEHNHLKKIYVDPKLHGRGIGKKILEHLEKTALNNGVKEVVLYAYDNSKGFYEKNGYRIIGPAVCGYNGEDALKGIEMRKIIS